MRDVQLHKSDAIVDLLKCIMKNHPSLKGSLKCVIKDCGSKNNILYHNRGIKQRAQKHKLCSHFISVYSNTDEFEGT